MNFCYLRKTFLNPDDKKNNIKNWCAKPFMKIPFNWHIKRMFKYADTYNKNLYIYAGDYDVTLEEVIERLTILNRYFEV